MKKTMHISAIVVAATLIASAGIAEIEAPEPRILTLPGTADAVLPGDQSGTRHGVKINRGSGFPEPVVVVVEPEPEVVQPVRRTRGLSLRRSYSW